MNPDRAEALIAWDTERSVALDEGWGVFDQHTADRNEARRALRERSDEAAAQEVHRAKAAVRDAALEAEANALAARVVRQMIVGDRG